MNHKLRPEGSGYRIPKKQTNFRPLPSVRDELSVRSESKFGLNFAFLDVHPNTEHLGHLAVTNVTASSFHWLQRKQRSLHSLCPYQPLGPFTYKAGNPQPRKQMGREWSVTSLLKYGCMAIFMQWCPYYLLPLYGWWQRKLSFHFLCGILSDIFFYYYIPHTCSFIWVGAGTWGIFIIIIEGFQNPISLQARRHPEPLGTCCGD